MTESPLDHAKELVESGQPVAAVDVLRAYLTENPDDPVAWRRLASALVKTTSLVEALVAVDRSIALAPRDGLSHRIRAVVLSGAGRPAEALLSAREAVRCAPRDAESNAILAMLLAGEKGGGDEARAASRRATALDPTNPVARQVSKSLRDARIGYRLRIAAVICFAQLPVLVLVALAIMDDDVSPALMLGSVALCGVGLVLGLVTRQFTATPPAALTTAPPAVPSGSPLTGPATTPPAGSS